MKADRSYSATDRPVLREPAERTEDASSSRPGHGLHLPHGGQPPTHREGPHGPASRRHSGGVRPNSGQGSLFDGDEDEAGTSILDLGLRDRQAAGLAALLSLATSLPAKEGYGGGSGTRLDDLTSRPSATAPPQGRLARIKTRVASDHMLRNSLYLMINSGLQAGLGFAFWITTARLFDTADVGRASSLLSATTVIAYLSLLGLNSTFVRYLATAHDRDTLITSGLLVVAICGATVGFLYARLTPLLAPRVDFIEQRPAMMAVFVLMTATAAVNLLTDSVFVASRRADLTALVDGGMGGVGKVGAAFLLVGGGAWGVYSASAAGIVLSTVASLLLIVISLRTRFALRRPLKTLRPWLGFSGANYVGNLFYMVPTLAVPLIVLDRLGSTAAGYYFIAYQVASILFSAAVAVEQTFLAEGSRQSKNTSMRQLRRRSGRTLALLCVPPSLLMMVGGRWLLLAFGQRYYHNAAGSLAILALAAGPVALNNWALTLLRLAGKLRAIVFTTATYAASICGLAWIGASHGLTGVAVAWPAGALLGAGVARGLAPRNARPRHRRVRSGYGGADAGSQRPENLHHSGEFG